MKIRRKIKRPSNPKFNLTGLKGIYNQALENDEKTIVFEVPLEIGTFVFMMFFDDDDKSKDMLYIYLKRTGHMLSFKMYASHKEGDFYIYIKPSDVQAIKHELDIQDGTQPFNVLMVLGRLNQLIPTALPFSDKVSNLKKIWPHVSTSLSGVLHEADKIYFSGLMDLSKSKRKPSEKTLRKLYLYVDAQPETIKQFIVSLKSQQKTCCWTSDQNREKPFSLL
ncbi:hypothetical protein ABK988_22475 [Vibrio parahaemolyticus]|nr:hypothetical protein [Vibrio parahaemolyticus]